jgi:pimeloyl-ACP methyl ester carboxylesterase
MRDDSITEIRGTDGPADTLVLVHGSGDSARCWDGVRERLGDDGPRVVALDLPGHGTRTGEPLLEPSVVAYAGWVRDQLRAAGIARAMLAGHSLGSAIVLRLALDDPQLVAHAVLIGAGARLRVQPALLELARSDAAQLVELGHAPEHAGLAAAYLASLAPIAPGALANDLAVCDGFDVMRELAALQTPVSILVGEHDRLTPPKYARYLAEHIVGSRLHVVAGAGHYLMDEAPDEVARALREAAG